MNAFAKAAALSALAVLATAAGHATEKPVHVATLNCTAPTLSANVYAYYFDTGQSNPRYFSVYLAGSMFNQMSIQEFFGSPYSTCSISTLGGTTADNVTIEDVTAYGSGTDVNAGALSEDAISQNYTLVDFSYSSLFIGNKAAVSKVPATDEEKEKAASFAAYKARTTSIPKP